ncbi:MAG: sporulation transcriptional regulator SpoIIID [Oscillospiraceae bacterium]|nr:sporulation transcriptional regulator SpoIIID [Oscillospiraceae bacterium]
MKGEPNERAVRLGEYIIETHSTVRGAAAQFGISKSTVHKDLQERLPKISPSLYPQVRVILDKNKEERHIRGGLATKQKYFDIAQNKK